MSTSTLNNLSSYGQFSFSSTLLISLFSYQIITRIAFLLDSRMSCAVSATVANKFTKTLGFAPLWRRFWFTTLVTVVHLLHQPVFLPVLVFPQLIVQTTTTTESFVFQINVFHWKCVLFSFVGHWVLTLIM